MPCASTRLRLHRNHATIPPNNRDLSGAENIVMTEAIGRIFDVARQRELKTLGYTFSPKPRYGRFGGIPSNFPAVAK